MIRNFSMQVFIALGMALCSGVVGAQNNFDNPEWVEQATGPAPTFSTTTLIPIDMPPYVSLKVGIDPATVTVGKDGVVRYVVVMTNSSGSVNAAFEGIRCATDEVKTYARQSSAGQWSQVVSPQWRAINDNMPSRHAFVIARQGACQDHLAPNVAEVLNALKERKKTVGIKER